MSGPPVITPEQTFALVVGIEAYPRRKGLDLQGPAADALKIAAWLRRRGVPAANIKVLVSAHAAELSAPDLAGVELVNGPVTLDSVTGALDSFRRTAGKFLFVFWTGHGIMTADHVRRPLLANYSDTDTHNLNIESLQEHLRSSTYAYPPYQVMVFDMCATLFDERLRRESLIDHHFQSGPARLDAQQFLLFAAADRQTAENLLPEGTGLYFRELLVILEQEASWPPDMQSVVGKLETRFDELRAKRVTAQEPIYQYWRAPSGKAETKYLGAVESRARRAWQWVAVALACIVPPLLLSEFVLGLAPPWPEGGAIPLSTMLLPLFVYLGIAHWSMEKSRPWLETLLRRSLVASVAAAVLYLFLFVQFTHPLPDHWHREVGGFTYAQRAQWYRDENPGIPDRDLIRDMGNDVARVYGAGSLGLMRMLMVGSWFALFVSVSSVVSAYLILRRFYMPRGGVLGDSA